jgi:hypothetical protein
MIINEPKGEPVAAAALPGFHALLGAALAHPGEVVSADLTINGKRATLALMVHADNGWAQESKS